MTRALTCFSMLASMMAFQSWESLAYSADAATKRSDSAVTAKPDCSEKQKAYDADKAATAAVVKADLSSCKEKKGKDKTECEKSLKDKEKTDRKASMDKEQTAKHELDCCKNSKIKGCM